MSVVVVTGANGFVGSVLCARLEREGVDVRRVVRSGGAGTLSVGDIDPDTDWAPALAGCDAVVHLAGAAHAAAEGSHAGELQRVNVDATRHLAERAVDHGVRRLVFVSSIGVHGDVSSPEAPIDEQSPIRPVGPYAASKWAAERSLADLAGQIELVIVRPPLVYGPGAPGNLARLARWAASPVPMPFAAIGNQRSLIGVDNLADFLAFCVDVELRHDQEIFVVSDGADISTTQLVRGLFPGKRLIPFPRSVARLVARAMRRPRLYHQLWGDLVVDSSHARIDYRWTPPITPDVGLQRCQR